MGRKLKNKIIILILFTLLTTLIGVTILLDLKDYYGLISVVFLALILLQRFVKFENQATGARDLMLIAILSALAAVSRVPFAGLPSIQPTSTVIILSAFVFGPNMGFMIGAIGALVSNMFLGQGPWTPWQMFAWGSMGYIVGLISVKWQIKGRILLSCIGFVLGLVFGWVMNLWFVIGFLSPITFQSIVATYATSFYMDLLHGISNAVLIFLLYKPWMVILDRIKNKYNIQ